MLDNVKNGLKDLFSNKLRLFLTVGGITIGVLSVIVISSIGAIGKDIINQKLSSMGMESIVISANKNNAAGLNENDLERIKEMYNVKNAMPLMSNITYSVSQDEIDTKNVCMVWGVNEDANNVIDLNTIYGRLINKGDLVSNSKICIIDEQLAKDIYKRENIVGHSVSVNIGGELQEYEVVGVVENGVNMLQSMLGSVIPSFIYIPYTTMQEQTSQYCFDEITVKLNSPDNNAEQNIERIITAGRDYPLTNLSIENLLQQKEQLSSIMDTVTIVLTIIAGISLVVSGLSIMTVMMVSVNERTREIGIKKSIGAKNSDILIEFLIESALITFIGGIIGALLGTSITIIGCIIMDIEIFFSLKIVIGMILFSMITGLIFGVYPAYRASRLKPVDALRYE